MRLRSLCAAVILSGCTLAGSAQMGSTSAKVAPGTQMSPAQAQDELLNLFEQEFMGVAKAMPADKYGFAPASTNGAEVRRGSYVREGDLPRNAGELLLRCEDSRREPRIDRKASTE